MIITRAHVYCVCVCLDVLERVSVFSPLSTSLHSPHSSQHEVQDVQKLLYGLVYLLLITWLNFNSLSHRHTLLQSFSLSLFLSSHHFGLSDPDIFGVSIPIMSVVSNLFLFICLCCINFKLFLNLLLCSENVYVHQCVFKKQKKNKLFHLFHFLKIIFHFQWHNLMFC